MSLPNSTIPFQLEETEHRGYYIRGQYYWQSRASETDFEAVTEPLNIAANNGIDGTFATLRTSSWPTFDIANGSCANSSDQYLDRRRERGTCFDTCHDSSTLFLPFNMETCLQLATIGILIGNGSLEVDYSDKTKSVVDSFGIGDLASWNGTKILMDVVQCVVSSCDDNSIGPCSPSVRGLSGIAVNAETLQDISQSLDHFCDDFDARLNPDIAGPGVSASLLASDLNGSR